MRLLLSLCLLLATTDGHATLIKMPFPPNENNYRLFDPESQLFWLPLGATWGSSTELIDMLTAPGEPLAGYRYATFDEMAAMTSRELGLGCPLASVFLCVTIDPGQLFTFISNFGVVPPNEEFGGYTSGVFAVERFGTMGTATFASFYLYPGDPVSGAPAIGANDIQGANFPVLPFGNFGHFLVLATPEPNTATLVGVVLVLYGIRRRMAR